MDGLRIAADDPGREDVRRLVASHLAFSRDHTAPDEVYALDAGGLADPGVTVYSARIDGRLVGVAALRRIGHDHGEVKSMHTAAEVRGQGVGRALVAHLVAVARERGYRRLSLETGAGPAFAPARSLYLGCGFTPCEPFGGYRPSPNSVCMTLPL